MSQPFVRAEIDAIEAKITAGLQEDRTGQGWQLQLDGAQWGIVLEALRRYKTQALMALESYPLRVEELSARGEIVQDGLRRPPDDRPCGLPGSRRAVSQVAHSAARPRPDHGRARARLKGGTSPPPVALKAIDNPDSDCSAIRRLKVQTAIRPRQHRSRHLRADFLCDDLNFALFVHCLHTSGNASNDPRRAKSEKGRPGTGSPF